MPALSQQPTSFPHSPRKRKASTCTTPPLPSLLKNCAECDQTFLTERMLHLHHRVQHARLPCHHCPHCGSAFGRAVDLNRHVLFVHDRRQMAVKCRECVCAFHTAFQLRQHALIAHQREILRCTECPFESNYQGVMDKHLKVKHDIAVQRAVQNPRVVGFEEMREKVFGYIVVPQDQEG